MELGDMFDKRRDLEKRVLDFFTKRNPNPDNSSFEEYKALTEELDKINNEIEEILTT
jgi:hypothetical protein